MAFDWHRPSLFSIILTLVGLAFFLVLGFWQIDRAHQKERLFAAFAGAQSSPTLHLSEARHAARTAVRYPHIAVRGRYDTEHTYLLDNQFRDGHVGVIAYAVFEPADGSTPLLVARGFLARSGEAQSPHMPPLPDGDQDLHGLYTPPPGSGLRLGNALPDQHDWPKTTLYIDTGEIGRDIGRSPDTRILLLDPETDSGFVREWKPQVFPPARHYGYAMTWFSFALLSVGLFVGMHWRRRRT